jgi:hypothetical protein
MHRSLLPSSMQSSNSLQCISQFPSHIISMIRNIQKRESLKILQEAFRYKQIYMHFRITVQY